MKKSTLDKIIEDLQARYEYTKTWLYVKESDGLNEAIKIVQRHAKKTKAVKRK